MKKLTKLMSVFLVTSMLAGAVGCQMSPDDSTTQGGNGQEQGGNGQGGNGGGNEQGNGNGGGNEQGGNGQGGNGGGNEQGNGNGGGNEQGGNEQTVPTVENIVFPAIPADWVGTFRTTPVNIAVGSVMAQLADQAYAIADQCSAERDTNSLINELYLIQRNIGLGCQDSNVNGISVESVIGSLKNVINNNFGFANPAYVFCEANALEKREFIGYVNGYYVNPNEKDTKEATLLAKVNEMGITADSIPDAITELRAVLAASMPAEFAAYAQSIIKQLEDTGRYEGFIADLGAIGYENSIQPQRPQQTRASVQTANGIVK